jgi:pimeloyl-ACP methyl ester carboxylesterase
MKRRALMLGTAALGFGSLRGLRAEAKPLESSELDFTELKLPGDAAFGRALLAVPKLLPARPELLVLLHGLGETHDQEIGAHAFAERYGLLTAVSRLLQPPLARTLSGVDYFGKGRLEAHNQRLSERPFRCPVLLCPFTPNPYKAGGDALLARYAGFVGGPLKTEVEKRVATSFPASRCMISGVSLGGYVAIEVFLRRPELFCALGLAQGAFGQNQAARYAAAIAKESERLGARRVEILTSTLDPYRKPNELLHQHLLKKQQSSRFLASPGPHDQRWLKESGVIEMLLSADDVFRSQAAAP